MGTAGTIGVALGVLTAIGPGRVRANEAPADRADRAAFAGLDVRADLGTHVVRLSGGVRFGDLAANLVLDPFGYLEGSQHDTDVFVEWDLWRAGWAVLGGWRFESNPVLGVRYHHEKPFVGVSAAMPGLLFGHVRARFAAELALTLVEHGRRLPDVWFWEHEEVVRDSLDLGFFLRIEYARGL